jgi:hypothetical protein
VKRCVGSMVVPALTPPPKLQFELRLLTGGSVTSRWIPVKSSCDSCAVQTVSSAGSGPLIFVLRVAHSPDGWELPPPRRLAGCKIDELQDPQADSCLFNHPPGSAADMASA